MLKAIHKSTGKIISAFKLENDSSWMGKEKDEWVAPRYMVYDYKEKGDIKVFFTKSHIRDNSPVVAHFKHESNREIYDTESESKEHKMAKEGVYQAIMDGSVEIDNKPLKEFIEDIEFEYPISPTKNSKIADVIVIFKEWHPIYGKGIIFEVQFSNQNDIITQDRTFNRLSEGFSICWLWEGNFQDNKLKLKNIDNSPRPLEIIPFSKTLEMYNTLIESKSIANINKISNLLDKKLGEYILLINKNEENKSLLDNSTKYFVSSINNAYKDNLLKLSTDMSSQIKSESIGMINKSIEEINNFIKTSVEQHKENFLKELAKRIYEDNSIKTLVKEKVDSIFNEGVDKEIKQKMQNISITEEKIEDTMKDIILKRITFNPKEIWDKQGVIL